MNPEEKNEPIMPNGRAGCATLVEQVSSHVSREPLPSAEELTQAAGHAFEMYAEMLLRDLVTTESTEAAIRHKFSEGLDSAGVALREVLAECRYRHTISQGLQRKMFEAENRLRAALKSRFRNQSAVARAAAS